MKGIKNVKLGFNKNAEVTVIADIEMKDDNFWNEVSDKIYEDAKLLVNKDLEKQDYKNLEIIIVDQSDNFDREFYSNWILDIKYIRQEEKALWLARNQAVKISRGDFILLSEDDVRFNHNFISNHLKIIDFYNDKIPKEAEIK